MKNFKILLLLLLVLSGVFGIYFYNNKKIQNLPSPTSSVMQKVSTTLLINGPNPQTINIDEFIGKTALEATQNFTKIEKKGSGENTYITSINGVYADPDKREFWEFVINGQSAQVGAGSYIIQKGDSISWKLNNY